MHLPYLADRSTHLPIDRVRRLNLDASLLHSLSPSINSLHDRPTSRAKTMGACFSTNSSIEETLSDRNHAIEKGIKLVRPSHSETGRRKEEKEGMLELTFPSLPSLSLPSLVRPSRTSKNPKGRINSSS